MRSAFSLALMFVAALASVAAADDAESKLRVMTFNIRYDNPGDGVNAWKHRRDWLAEIVVREKVDFVGMQEVVAGQLADLKERLPGMTAYGVGRDDGKAKGEFVPIFFRDERFEKLDAGTFWLSTTPDRPGSKDWDAAITRTLSWLKLKDRRTGRTLFALNTHFDHRGPTARKESAALVLERLQKEFAAHPVILTGDFNTRPDSPPYDVLTGKDEPGERKKLLFRDSYLHSAEKPAGPDSTWNGFTKIVPGQRIDFIFVTPTIKVLKLQTLDDQKDGRFPSDHLPVVVELEVGK